MGLSTAGMCMQARLDPPSTSTSTTSTTTRNGNSTWREPGDRALLQEEQEEFGLMQHALPSATFFVHLENENEPLVEQLMDLEVREPVLSLQRRFERRVRETRREELLFFRINPQPPDLGAMQATGYLHTLVGQLPSGRSLVMLDIEFYTNDRPRWRERPSPTDEWRETRLVDSRMTRQEFVMMVGMHTFCYGTDTTYVVLLRGRVWPIQDEKVRDIASGDYLIIKAKIRDTTTTVLQQWRSANGVCQEPPRQAYQQALIDYAEHQDRGSSEEQHRIVDNVSFIQLWRPTAVREASQKLPPPGNGRQITFNEEVEVDSGDRRQDWAMTNRFIQAFCETRQEEDMMELEKNFLHDVRFEDMASKESGGADVFRLDLLPISTSNMEEEFEVDYEQENDTDEKKTWRRGRQEGPFVLSLREALGGQTVRTTLSLDTLLPNDFKEQHSTAVQEPTFSVNPRLDCSLHVHEKKVKVEGLDRLRERLLDQDHICLLPGIPKPELFKEDFFSKIIFGRVQGLQVDAVRIFTDGSCLWNAMKKREAAAWAFVVTLVYTDGTQSLLGHLASELLLQGHQDHTGARNVIADDAEADALIWAVRWALQAPIVEEVKKVEIYTDSRTKAFGIEGVWALPDNPQKVYMQALYTMLQQRVGVNTFWVKAHHGELYNEVVDHVAKSLARFPEELAMNLAGFELGENYDAMAWLWAAERAIWNTDVPRVQNDELCFREPEPLCNESLAKETEVEDWGVKEVSFDIHMITYNTNTLSGFRAGLPKREIIMEQLRELEVNVIGLQETRRRKDLQWVSPPFFGFSSGAREGQGGLDLIFRSDISYATCSGDKRFFHQQDFTVVSASERIMMVRMYTQDVIWGFCVAHAPREMSSSKEKEVFWGQLRDAFHRARVPEVFLMIDANARVGSLSTDGCGVAFADMTNTNGEFLQHFVQERHLFLPSTFLNLIGDSESEQGAWQHASGKLARIDYYILPNKWEVHDACQTKVCDIETL